MCKNLIIAGLLVALILGVGIYEQFYVVDTLEHVSDSANEILSRMDDMDMSHQEIQRLTKYWQSRQKMLGYMYSCNEFSTISSIMAELNGNIVANDTDSAVANATHLSIYTAEKLYNLRYILSNIL